MFYDTALLLAAFLTLGRYLESHARRRSSSALRALLGLRPATATILGDNKERIVPVSDVVPGDCVRIKPGDKIPVDGTVIDGEGYVDESMISGESMPVLKKKRRYGNRWHNQRKQRSHFYGNPHR